MRDKAKKIIERPKVGKLMLSIGTKEQKVSIMRNYCVRTQR